MAIPLVLGLPFFCFRLGRYSALLPKSPAPSAGFCNAVTSAWEKVLCFISTRGVEKNHGGAGPSPAVKMECRERRKRLTSHKLFLSAVSSTPKPLSGKQIKK